MDFGALIPVAGILGGAWMLSSIIRLWTSRRSADVADTGEVVRLKIENDGLKATVGQQEERLRVLERIATDPAERTAREIEQLR